jgi:hypothetical protein
MPLESLKYSIPYISLIIFYILLFFTEYLVRKQDTHSLLKNQIIRLLSIGGLLFFFGLRGFVGWDWTIYYPGFDTVPPLYKLTAGFFADTRFEYGFVTYFSAIKTIWNNYHFFIFINTLIDLLIIRELFKQYSKTSFSMSCLLFIIMGGFYLETDLIRNAKSIMIFLLSIKYLQERKILPYFILNLIGCMFHISAVIFLPLYFFIHKMIPKKIVLTIFISGLIIFILQIEYVSPILNEIATALGEKFTIILGKYLRTNQYSTAYGYTIGFVERVVTSGLIIYYYDAIIKQNRHNILFINSYILFFFFFFFFAEIRIIPIRVGGLFYFSYWILYPAIYNAIQKRNNRIIFISYIFCYSLIKIAGMTDNILYRYVNVLLSADSVEARLRIFESSSDILFK